MLEFEGKYAKCKVMIDSIEETAVTQIYSFLNSPAFEGSTIRIMPDVHAGAGAVVGFTGTLTDKVIPNVVGVDIGCGIASIDLGYLEADRSMFTRLDTFIRQNIPSGFSVHASRRDDKAEFQGSPDLEEEIESVCKETDQNFGRVLKSLQTLGGGNHFIELGKDELKHSWLTIHTGSRNFGLKIANHHQHIAVKTAGKGHGLEWLEGDKKNQYLAHMKVAQKFASTDRKSVV